MLNIKRSAASKWLLYTVVTLGFVAVITPFVWMILGSFKGQGELLRVPPTWWPESPTLDNYRSLFGKQSFLRYFFNSAFVAVVITVANVTFSSMVGYALAKLVFRGKKLVFALVMGTLMIPGMVTFVPLFVLVANLGRGNNFLWPLVVAQTQNYYTLPVALALFSNNQQFIPNYGVLLGGATVVVVPVLIVFLIFQRRFIEGIASTGIK